VTIPGFLLTTGDHEFGKCCGAQQLTITHDRAYNAAMTPAEPSPRTGSRLLTWLLAVALTGTLGFLWTQAAAYGALPVIAGFARRSANLLALLTLLPPALWLVAAGRRRAWPHINAALLLLILAATVHAGWFWQRRITVANQEAALVAFIPATFDQLHRRQVVDTAPLTPEHFGPYLPVAAVLAAQCNARLTGMRDFAAALTACGLGRDLLAARRMASATTLATARRNAATSRRLVQERLDRQPEFRRQLLAAADSISLPAPVRALLTDRIDTLLQPADTREATELVALLDLLRAYEKMYGFLTKHLDDYAIVSRRPQFRTPAAGVAYIRLLTEVDARAAAYLQACAAGDTPSA